MRQMSLVIVKHLKLESLRADKIPTSFVKTKLESAPARLAMGFSQEVCSSHVDNNENFFF